MIELLTSAWMYLAGAGAIGLILGWAVRGAFLPRAKTVTVTTQPMAKPMLSAEQIKLLDEAEETKQALSAAQERATGMENALSALKRQLESAQGQLANYADQIAEAASAPKPEMFVSEMAPQPELSNDEIEKLEWMNRYFQARLTFIESELAHETAHVAELTEASAEDEDARAAAVWSQRYLESRVRFLEGKLAAAESAPQSITTSEPDLEDHEPNSGVFSLTDKLRSAETVAFAAETVEEDVSSYTEEAVEQSEYAEAELDAEEDLEPTPAAISAAKLSWQNRYLKARINHLENVSPAPLTVVSTPSSQALEEIDALRSQVRTLKTELSKVGEGNGDAEQELAKLRWRNRYLEGRLKYLEAATLDAESDADDAIIIAEPGPYIETPDTMTEDQPKAADEADNVLAFIQPAPSEPSVDEVRPPSFDAPEGTADDLRRIGGIGPKIEGILNQLGIFHYRQIASWNRSEEAWIDSYLRFQGRVMREKWVEQASNLAQASDQ